MAPQLCLFYVPGQPSKKTLFEKPWSDGEEITTGNTGTTFCIRSGHKINWFLASETLPVFPVVTIRYISRDKGQKAGPHMGKVSGYGLSKGFSQNAFPLVRLVIPNDPAHGPWASVLGQSHRIGNFKVA